MKNYDVYALGNALVDIEYHVDAQQLVSMGIDKGVMTLIDEHQHNHLVNHLGDSHEKMACGGSAANTVIAVAQFGGQGYFSCSVADDITGQFFVSDLQQTGIHTNSHLLMDAKVGVTALAADITSEAGRSRALEVCPEPDILVNNAGGPPPGDFSDWTRDD